MNTSTKLSNQFIDSYSTDDRLFKVKDIPSTGITVHNNNQQSTKTTYSSNSNSSTVSGTVKKSTDKTKFCVMRVGKKYHTLQSLSSFFRYMNREFIMENADAEKTESNIFLKNTNYEDIKEYLKSAKRQKNSVLALDLLLTASREFFLGLNKEQIDLWIKTNHKWLEETFGEHYRYGIVHNDQATPHCHILLSFKCFNEKLQRDTMQTYKFLGTPKKLIELQDSYAAAMNQVFPELQRGIKNSRNFHISTQTFYKIISGNGTEQEEELLKAKASMAEILEMKLKYADKTLKNYIKKDIKNRELIEQIKSDNDVISAELNTLKDDKKLQQETLNKFAETYGIPLEKFSDIYKSLKTKQEFEEFKQRINGPVQSQTKTTKLSR